MGKKKCVQGRRRKGLASLIRKLESNFLGISLSISCATKIWNFIKAVNLDQSFEVASKSKLWRCIKVEVVKVHPGQICEATRLKFLKFLDQSHSIEAGGRSSEARVKIKGCNYIWKANIWWLWERWSIGRKGWLGGGGRYLCLRSWSISIWLVEEFN